MLYRSADAIDPAAAPASSPIRSTPTCTGRVRRTANVNRSFDTFMAAAACPRGSARSSRNARSIASGLVVMTHRSMTTTAQRPSRTSAQPDPERTPLPGAHRTRVDRGDCRTCATRPAAVGELLHERDDARGDGQAAGRARSHGLPSTGAYPSNDSRACGAASARRRQAARGSDRAVLRVRARRPRSARPGQHHAQGFGGGSFYMMRIR